MKSRKRIKHKKNMMSRYRNHRASLLAPLIITLVCFALAVASDYWNLPTALHIRPRSLNMDILGMLFDALIAAVVFIITYYLVEKWDIAKSTNQRETARYLIRLTARICQTYVMDLDNDTISDLLIEVKNSNNDTLKKIDYYSNYENSPFEYDEYIMQFLTDGVLPKGDFVKYMKMKQYYQAYISVYSIKKPINGIEHYLEAMRKELIKLIRIASEV